MITIRVTCSIVPERNTAVRRASLTGVVGDGHGKYCGATRLLDGRWRETGMENTAARRASLTGGGGRRGGKKQLVAPDSLEQLRRYRNQVDTREQHRRDRRGGIALTRPDIRPRCRAAVDQGDVP